MPTPQVVSAVRQWRVDWMSSQSYEPQVNHSSNEPLLQWHEISHIPQLPKTMSPVGDQVFKHRNLRGAFHIQNTTSTLSHCCMSAASGLLLQLHSHSDWLRGETASYQMCSMSVFRGIFLEWLGGRPSVNWDYVVIIWASLCGHCRKACEDRCAEQPILTLTSQ